MSIPTTPVDRADLPVEILGYLDRDRAEDLDGATARFTPDAVVIDDGRTHDTPEAIRSWLDWASTAFTYTTTFLHAEATGPGQWMVTNRLAGDFPGGVVDLHYRFQVRGGRIARLVIEA